MLFVYIAITAILMRKFHQFSRQCSRDGIVEGLYRPPVQSRRWVLISVSFLLVVLFLPLSTISLHVIVWSEDLWVVPNPYVNATVFPPILPPLGPPEEFKDPLDFCWTSTMKKNDINWAPVLVIVSMAVWSLVSSVSLQ